MCKTTLVRCVFFMMICMSKNQENSAWLTSISGRRRPPSTLTSSCLICYSTFSDGFEIYQASKLTEQALLRFLKVK